MHNLAKLFRIENLNHVKLTPGQMALAGAVGFSSLLVLYRRWQASRRLSPVGKAVFITGCDTGFGRACALEFHRSGFLVFAGCLDPETATETTFSELKGSSNFHVVKIDITNQQVVDNAVTYIDQWLIANPDYRLWCLVNNAGTSSFGPLEFVSMQTVERVVNVNLIGTYRVTKSLLPLLRRQPGGGRVIFMASVGGLLECPFTAAYGSSKAGVFFLADTLRMELDQFGIEVSSIAPDYYKTNIFEPASATAALENEISRTDPATVQHYGEAVKNRLMKFINEVSPTRAKADLSPVVDAVVEAASAFKPKRRYFPIEGATKVAMLIHDFAPNLYFSIMKNFI